jgi:hypothetical protein
MKIQYLLIPIIALAGCSSSRYPSIPNTQLMVESHTTQMSRNEIINGVNECEGNGLRPVVITTRRKINGFITDVPVDLTCYPDQRRYNKLNP